jgi:electron transfer flavoprotein beta subunit
LDTVVFVKRVPFTQEVELELDRSGRSVITKDLPHVINDWDSYAVEEAIVLKERLGGEVTAITVGSEDDEEVLRRALAMGADRAVRIDPGNLSLDPGVTARLLAAVVRGMRYDLILSGVQADDDGAGAVGVMTAEHLGIAHAAVVRGLEVTDDGIKVRVELEGGVDEVRRLPLPALLTVQTGINEPRYVSVMGIRKAAKKELRVVAAGELGLKEEDLRPTAFLEEVYLPPDTGMAEMISGDPPKVAETIIEIMRRKGVAL